MRSGLEMVTFFVTTGEAVEPHARRVQGICWILQYLPRRLLKVVTFFVTTALWGYGHAGCVLGRSSGGCLISEHRPMPWQAGHP